MIKETFSSIISVLTGFRFYVGTCRFLHITSVMLHDQVPRWSLIVFQSIVFVPYRRATPHHLQMGMTVPLLPAVMLDVDENCVLLCCVQRPKKTLPQMTLWYL